MKLLTTLLPFALFASAAFAQVSTGEISGTVTDTTGAAVPNAKIIATNTETNVVGRETTSAGDGNYVMTLLPPGTYSMSVEAGGFRKSVQTGIILQTNQRARLDFQLQVGQVTETLEVAASAPLLESTSSSLGAVINQQLVGELPLNGRNFVQLAILSPGVNGAGFSTGGTIQSGTRPDDRRPGTEIFSNGNREGSNNFLYDGVDNNERLIQLIVLRPAVEAIREFKVQTNMYSADLGRNSGAVVDVVTKSGTNYLHGSRLRVPPQLRHGRAQFLQRQGHRVPAVPLQPIRLLARRPDHQEQDVLVRRLRRLPPHPAKLQHLHDSHGGASATATSPPRTRSTIRSAAAWKARSSRATVSPATRFRPTAGTR